MGVRCWFSKWTDVQCRALAQIRANTGYQLNSGDNMDLLQIFLALIYLNRAAISQPVESKKTCMYKDKTSEARVCTAGKTLLKSKEEFPPPWKYACEGCTMNGKIVCKGTVVRDLYRWWYVAQCDRGLMRPIGRQWGEVAADPRFTGP